MTRREALLASIFGSDAAPLVEAADVSISGNTLVVTFAKDHCPFDLDQMEGIRANLADIVRGVPVVACIPNGTRIEPLDEITMVHDAGQLTLWYDPEAGSLVDKRPEPFTGRGYTDRPT